MNVLDLFSGIGGFSLGLEAAGMTTVAFCEKEAFCKQILQKHWPEIPIHDDVIELKGEDYAGRVDLVCGGYPCQPFSAAGQRRGHKDERHLWPEMLRIIQGCRPRWVIAENVAGHVSLGFDDVATSLESNGFTVWPFIIPACAVGAPHRRDRIWIVAHTHGVRLSGVHSSNGAEKNNNEIPQKWGADWIGHYVRPQINTRVEENWKNEIQPRLVGVDDGFPSKLVRGAAKASGNAVVPEIPYLIGKTILEYEACLET